MSEKKVTKFTKLYLILAIAGIVWICDDFSFLSNEVGIEESTFQKDKEESREEVSEYHFKKSRSGNDKNPDTGELYTSDLYERLGFLSVQEGKRSSFIFSKEKLYLLYGSLRIDC